MPGDRRFATSLGASALLHLLVLSALFLYVTMPHRPAPVPTVDVDLSSLPLPAPPHAAPAPKQVAKAEPAPPAPPPVAVPRQQIVEPSDRGEEKEPPKTNLLSDRNNTVPEEIVRHGDHGTDENATESRLSHKGGGGDTQEPPKQAQAPPAAVPERPKPQARPAPPAAAPPKERPRAPAAREPGDDAQRLASLPSLDKLLPNAADLAQRQPAPRATPEAQRTGRDLLNSGGEVFSGRPGTRDYLPHIRQGNITMLNTKADLFAPFVRRVAGRVFENLDLALGTVRSGRPVGNGRAVAVVEAVMDRKGRFVAAKLMESNGLSAAGLDRILLSSTTPDTFFDANPPSGAEAADGNIHFILVIDLTFSVVGDPRTGREAPAYYGVASVGLS